MEEELLRRQSLIVTIGYESSTFWTKVIFQKMWQGSAIESKRNSLSLYILLTDQSTDLGYVDIVTLGS